MSFLSSARMILHSLFKKPATEMYPIKVRQYGATTRGAVHNRIEDCIFCGACMRKCPAKAIDVSRDEKYWEIDRFKCVVCGECVAVCPKKCMEMKNTYAAPAATRAPERHTKPADPAPADSSSAKKTDA